MLDDLALMKRPDQWPIYPLLPLKRYGKPGERQHGVILQIDCLKEDLEAATGAKLPPEQFQEVRYCVYIGMDVFTPGATAKAILLGQAQNKEKYDSYEAILAAGWIVD